MKVLHFSKNQMISKQRPVLSKSGDAPFFGRVIVSSNGAENNNEWGKGYF